MQINTDGLVITETVIGESDRLITVLTRDEGILRAFVPHAKTVKSQKNSSTQLLCYSRFSIYRGRDKYIIDEARPLEVFFDLRKDITNLTLAQYFCEIASQLAPKEAPAEDFLRLLLNALHLLATQKRPPLLLKSAVEMRLLTLSGYMPDLIGCSVCGCYEAETMMFVPQKGKLFCADCFGPSNDVSFSMGKGVLTALRHTVYADFDKLFSFMLPPTGQKQLSEISERYMLFMLDHKFKTLDFYYEVTKF